VFLRIFDHQSSVVGRVFPTISCFNHTKVISLRSSGENDIRQPRHHYWCCTQWKRVVPGFIKFMIVVKSDKSE